MFILDGSTGNVFNSLAVGAAGKSFWEVQKRDAERTLAEEESKPTNDQEHDHGTQTVTGSNGESVEVASTVASPKTSKRNEGKITEAQALLAQAEYELGRMRSNQNQQEGQQRNDNRIQDTQNNPLV